MVELATLQAVSYIMGSLGVFVAAVYYINTLRNNQRTQQLQLETRQAQLLTNFSNILITSDSLWRTYSFWLDHHELEYKEFKQKYPKDSEGYKSLMQLFAFNEMVGLLSRRKLVDVELVHELFAFQWTKFKPIVKGMQEDSGSLFFMEHYEWLGEEYENTIKNKKIQKIKDS